MNTVAARSRLEVGDIFRSYGEAHRQRHSLSATQAAVLRRLAACRTAALGGHVEACDSCGYARVAYNSCRDRHCPKCQAAKRAQWLEVRLQRMLPVEHFHVVFTLPDSLNPLIRHNQRRLYDLLFQAAGQTLLTLAADPKRLGAQIGVTAILHTWSQNLLFHPHLHCVVTGGGLAADGSRWVAGRVNYFLPVRVLGRMFRGKFLDGLRQAHAQEQLSLTGSARELAEPHAWRRFVDRLYRQEWLVYAKRPFGSPERVFRYLGRYSHRVAISNSRLRTLENDHVSFQYKDYADDHRLKVMRLSADEFIRRFLLHVLPKRFVRIRHYGLLAGRNVTTRLAQCRQLLANKATPRVAVEKPAWLDQYDWSESRPMTCPHCHGPLVRRPLDLGTRADNLPAPENLPQPIEAVDST